MSALLCFFLAVLASPFKSRRRLEAENVALRYQLIVSGPESLVHTRSLANFIITTSGSRFSVQTQVQQECRGTLLVG